MTLAPACAHRLAASTSDELSLQPQLAPLNTLTIDRRTAFDNLYAQGVLSIAAAGNDGNTAHSYPASYDSVVSVAAVDSGKVVADFSQKTSQV